MTPSLVGQYTYDDFCRKVLFPDADLTVEKLISICKFLDGKKLEDNGRIVNNALDLYIYYIIRRPYIDPTYSKVIEDFIKSDYFSDKVKKDTYKMTKKLDNYKNVNKLLRSDIHVNDFDLETLNDINDAYYEYSEISEYDKNINIKIPIIFNRYMFILDGNGPVEFVKNNYTEEELGKEFLTNIGMIPVPSFYKENVVSRLEFNEEHLIAIYKQFEKYMPNKKNEFIKFIKMIEKLSAKEFITNYFKFVNNNYSCKNLELSNECPMKDERENKMNQAIKDLFMKHINKEKKKKLLNNNNSIIIVR